MNVERQLTINLDIHADSIPGVEIGVETDN